MIMNIEIGKPKNFRGQKLSLNVKRLFYDFLLENQTCLVELFYKLLEQQRTSEPEQC